MELTDKNNLTKQDLNNFFTIAATHSMPIYLELKGDKKRVARVAVFSASSKKENVVTFSWLKLDLSKYCGFKKEKNHIKIFFHCNIYKNIYFLENDFYYIYSSAIRHNNHEILAVLKEYLKEKEGIMQNDKLKFYGIEPINGQVRAVFYIDNLTSKDFAMALNYQELQEQLSFNMLKPDRRKLYAKALTSIEEYNAKLPNIHNYFDTYILEVA